MANVELPFRACTSTVKDVVAGHLVSFAPGEDLQIKWVDVIEKQEVR